MITRTIHDRVSNEISSMRIVFLIFFVMSPTLTSCQVGSFLPSRAFDIEFISADVSGSSVLSVAEEYLGEIGFEKMGKGGYDELHGTEKTVAYSDSNGIFVNISVDRSDRVPIRVSWQVDSSNERGNDVFNGLINRFEKTWPGASKEVP